jgi:hypothetical protein
LLPVYLILLALPASYRPIVPFILVIGGYVLTFVICKRNCEVNQVRQKSYDYPLNTPQGVTILIYGFIAAGALTEAFLTYQTGIDTGKRLENFRIRQLADIIAVIWIDPNNFLRLLTFFLIAFPFIHGAIRGLTLKPRLPLAIFVQVSLLFLMSKSITSLIVFVEWIMLFMAVNVISTVYYKKKKYPGFFNEWIFLNLWTVGFCITFLLVSWSSTSELTNISSFATLFNIGLFVVLGVRTYFDYRLLWRRYYSADDTNAKATEK